MASSSRESVTAAREMTMVCVPEESVTCRSNDGAMPPAPTMRPVLAAERVATAIERLLVPPFEGPLESLQAARRVTAPNAPVAHVTRAIVRSEDIANRPDESKCGRVQ